jgi:trehalose synthase
LENGATRAGWDFLRPHLGSAEAYVFSRRDYVPSWLPDGKVSIIPPSIDPFSPKNQDLDTATVRAILVKLGVLDGAAPNVPARFVRRNGDVDTVGRPAVITGEGRPGPDDPVVIQVSRWDRLKDMGGVMRAFADHVVPEGGGYLMLVDPAVAGVSDDPEGAAIYGGMPAAMARPAARCPGAHLAGDAAAGRHRRERRHGQRPATACHRHRAKEPR